tara:strand:- start:478 stop:1377 length:900 start_codon:yes stop_codon:yes gene_type:complete
MTGTTAITTSNYTERGVQKRAPDRFAFEPSHIGELGKFSDMVIKSGLCPRSLKSPEAVALVVIQGRELNLTSMAALQGLIAVNGTISFRSRFAAQMVIRSPDCELWQVLESKDMIGRVKVKRREWDEPQIVEYTEEDAKRANLWNSSDAWKKHPRDMLIARAISRAVNRHFPEVLGGVAVETDQHDAHDTHDAHQEQPEAPAQPTPGKGAATLAAALDVITIEPEAQEPTPEEELTREAAAQIWADLKAELIDLVGEEEASARCAEIAVDVDKKRTGKTRAKALDALRAIIAQVQEAGI